MAPSCCLTTMEHRMTADRDRVIAELPLPLAPGAGVLEALDIAVALEDALGVVLPDDAMDVSSLRDRPGVESVLDRLSPPS